MVDQALRVSWRSGKAGTATTGVNLVKFPLAACQAPEFGKSVQQDTRRHDLRRRSNMLHQLA